MDPTSKTTKISLKTYRRLLAQTVNSQVLDVHRGFTKSTRSNPFFGIFLTLLLLL